jgi:hypothetical protein
MIDWASEWDERFYALSRAHSPPDTLDTSGHMDAATPMCPTVSHVSVGENTIEPVVTGSRPAVEHKVDWIEEEGDASASLTFDSWGDENEERAGISEHDGGVPRAWAEGFARLNPDRPPGDVPLQRWRQFVDDVGLFLDSAFCAAATSLGWGPLDLFGCDRTKPFARIDKCGLLWLLNGRKLVALTENTATIETPTGARQTYYRRPERRGESLAWELTP